MAQEQKQKRCPHTRLPLLSVAELLARFDPSTHERLLDMLEGKIEGVGTLEAVALFENVNFDSSHFAERKALAVGPSCTYKTVEEIRGRWLNDLPSQRLYPTGICFVHPQVPAREFLPTCRYCSRRLEPELMNMKLESWLCTHCGRQLEDMVLVPQHPPNPREEGDGDDNEQGDNTAAAEE